jgi:hypothetical protein
MKLNLNWLKSTFSNILLKVGREFVKILWRRFGRTFVPLTTNDWRDQVNRKTKNKLFSFPEQAPKISAFNKRPAEMKSNINST